MMSIDINKKELKEDDLKQVAGGDEHTMPRGVHENNGTDEPPTNTVQLENLNDNKGANE